MYVCMSLWYLTYVNLIVFGFSYLLLLHLLANRPTNDICTFFCLAASKVRLLIILLVELLFLHFQRRIKKCQSFWFLLFSGYCAKSYDIVEPSTSEMITMMMMLLLLMLMTMMMQAHAHN